MLPNYTTTADAAQYKGDIDESINNTLKPVTTGGTGDAYTAALGISAYEIGRIYTVKFDRSNNTATPTLNIDGLGAKTIKNIGGSAVAVDTLIINHVLHFLYDGTDMIHITPFFGSVVVDSAGRLGINVTPENTWAAGWQILRAGQNFSIMSGQGNNDTYLLQNALWNGTGWVYITAGQEASALQMDPLGRITIKTAPTSANAGDPITWNNVTTVYNNGGVTYGSPTGGSKGVGSANFEKAYVQGKEVTGPSFRAFRGNTLSVAPVTDTTIPFNSETFDASNAYDIATGQFNPKIAGEYALTAKLRILAPDAGKGYTIALNHTSGEMAAFTRVATAEEATAGLLDLSISDVLPFDGNLDEVHVTLYHTSATAKTVTGGSPNLTFFSAHKVPS